MARLSLPTVGQVRTLPQLLTMTIPPEFEDANGHVNIQHYLGIYDKAGWPFFQMLDIDERYLSDERKGLFDLEHHLHYVAELLVGDVVSVYSRLVGRSAKRMHGVWFIVNDTRDQLANVFEFVTSHADLELRRTAPFPDHLVGKLDAMIAASATLDWEPPLCGVMGA